MEIPFYKTENNIPDNHCGLFFGGMEYYDDKNLGIRLRYGVYNNEKTYLAGKIDLYLYNLGYEKISNEVNSDFFQELAQEDYYNIEAIFKDYENFKMNSFGLNVGIKEVIGTEAWVGSLEFTSTIDDLLKVPFHDYYVLTKVENHFVKIRMTFANYAIDHFSHEEIFRSIFDSLKQNR